MANVIRETEAPNVIIHTVKSLRVSCPYCLVGYAEIIEQIVGDQIQIDGIKDPRKCVKCHNYFQLKPKVQIFGVSLEDK